MQMHSGRNLIVAKWRSLLVNKSPIKLSLQGSRMGGGQQLPDGYSLVINILPVLRCISVRLWPIFANFSNVEGL